VIYSNYNKRLLFWLIPIALAAFFISTGILIHNKILDRSDKLSRLYTTSIKVKNADEFNYSIDTKQGNVFTEGLLTTDTPVKFDEMDKSFLIIERYREKYIERTETYSCGTSDAPRTCTRTVHEWDADGEEKLKSYEVEIHNRVYSTDMFDFSPQKIKASELIEGTKSYYYPEGEPSGFFGDSVGDIRYYYKVIRNHSFGSFLVNTSSGLIAPISSKHIKVWNSGIETIINESNKKATFSKWAFIVVWTLFSFGIGGFIIYKTLIEF